MGEPLKKREITQQILSFYLMFAVIYAAASISDAHLLERAPLLPALLYSFIYVHNTVHIQVAHVTKQKFIPWTRVLIMNLTILGSYLFITIYQRRSIDSYMLFNVLICITSLSQWHYLICIIDEITDILSIRVFRVKPKVAPAAS